MLTGKEHTFAQAIPLVAFHETNTSQRCRAVDTLGC
jgi:hypothetical protein